MLVVTDKVFFLFFTKERVKFSNNYNFVHQISRLWKLYLAESDRLEIYISEIISELLGTL